jgi:hypothetical protein
MTRPWTPSAGDSLVASLFNSLFTWIEGLLTGGLDGTALADDAGISADQLADRYTLVAVPIVLVPQNLNTDITATLAALRTNGWEAPQNGTTEQVGEILVDLPSGLPAELTHIDFYLKEVLAGTGSSYPQVEVYRGADLLGGSAITLNASDYWFRLGATNPHDFPIDAVQPNDVIYFQLTSDDSSGFGTGAGLRGLRAIAWFKIRLTS